MLVVQTLSYFTKNGRNHWWHSKRHSLIRTAQDMNDFFQVIRTSMGMVGTLSVTQSSPDSFPLEKSPISTNSMRRISGVNSELLLPWIASCVETLYLGCTSRTRDPRSFRVRRCPKRTLLTPERECEFAEDPPSIRVRELSVARSEFASTDNRISICSPQKGCACDEHCPMIKLSSSGQRADGVIKV